MKSLYTEVGSKTESTNKCLRDGGNADGGGGSNHMPLQRSLRAHGFEVKLEEVIDYQGIVWEPIKVQLFRACCLLRLTLEPQKWDNVLTVYRPRDPKKEFIAKKVRKGSDELEILRFLDTIKPKPRHTISLVDSFDECIILPKLVTVGGYVSTKLGRNVVQVCSHHQIVEIVTSHREEINCIMSGCAKCELIISLHLFYGASA